MNKIAWQIISGLCRGIGWVFFLIMFFGDCSEKNFLKLCALAIVGVLGALVLGFLLFK